MFEIKFIYLYSYINMTSMEEQSRCFYLDSDYQPASDMLRKCVGDKTSPYRLIVVMIQ